MESSTSRMLKSCFLGERQRQRYLQNPSSRGGMPPMAHRLNQNPRGSALNAHFPSDQDVAPEFVGVPGFKSWLWALRHHISLPLDQGRPQNTELIRPPSCQNDAREAFTALALGRIIQWGSSSKDPTTRPRKWGGRHSSMVLRPSMVKIVFRINQAGGVEEFPPAGRRCGH